MEVNMEGLKHNLSGILTGVGCLGVITTAYFASEESAEASAVVREKKPANVHEHLMAVIPKRKKTIVSAGLTIGCIIGSHAIDVQTIAKLAGSYAALGGAFSRFKGEAKRYLGDKKFKELSDRVEEERIEETDDEVKHWFYEPISGQFFESTWKDVHDAINDAHKLFVLEGRIPFNDFVHFLGLKSKPFSDNVGWDMGDLLCELGYEWFDIESEKRNLPGKVDYNFNDGRETIELVYLMPPKEFGYATQMV